MGTLHPRSKQVIGRRLALAAAHVAYDQPDVPFTGPVLASCAVLKENAHCGSGDDLNSSKCNTVSGKATINQRQITLKYSEHLLGDDAVRVWPTAHATSSLTMLALYNCLNGTCLTECSEGNSTCAYDCTLQNGLCNANLNPNDSGGSYMRWQSGKSISPLEVEFNHSFWMPAAITFDGNRPQEDPLDRRCLTPGSTPQDPAANPKPCKNGLNYSRVDGWQSAVAQAPVSLPIGCGSGMDTRTGTWRQCPPQEHLRPGEQCTNCTAHFLITGVRYAWTESPCGGGNSDTAVLPLAVNACPISTWNSTLPAVPFSAKIEYPGETGRGVGRCVCTPPQVCN